MPSTPHPSRLDQRRHAGVGVRARRRVWALALPAVASLALGACGSSSSGGKKLPLGTQAVVDYTQQASGTTPAVDTRLGITVLAVRPGTQAELTAGGMKVDDDAKDATPYYVDVRYEDKGTGSLVRNLSVGMEDTKGNSVPTTIVITLDGSPYAPCPEVNSGAFNPGETYESCTLFLVPPGTKLDRVRFVSQARNATITFTDWAMK
jgi:hypothetical protein